MSPESAAPDVPHTRQLLASTDVANAICDNCGDTCFLKYLIPTDEVGRYVDRDVYVWSLKPVCKACYDAHIAGGVPALDARFDALDEARRRRVAPVIGTARA